MDDDTLNPQDPGDPEVVRRLEAFADVRLSPSVAATTRMRAAVMTVAHRRAALMEADAASAVVVDPAPVPSGPSTPVAVATGRAGPGGAARWTWRRPVAAVMAGILTIGILGGMAYSTKAGGPLYDARIWAEAANLPTARSARAEAEVTRLDQRLEETQSASAEGDGHATEAALIAYSSIVIEAGEGSAGDPTASTTITVTVTRHILVLRYLADVVPAPARPAAQQAITSSTKVLDDLGGTSQQQGVH